MSVCFCRTNPFRKGCTLPHVSKLKELLYSDGFRHWLQAITGIEVQQSVLLYKTFLLIRRITIQGLSDTIDMSCARYIDGSTLLCHDDELEGRRIAYIIYLVPKDWQDEDG